ncbi:MAG: OPT family oligopeptide transporter [Candidatus Bruticola sp.]
MREFTFRAVIMGVFFGALFGAASVYLALKAGMTVSASIPIAVLAISCGRRLFKTTILENNIIQTTGSASESIASGVIFTLPGFLFLSAGSDGPSFFHYWVIFILALCGGLLGTLMMVPLRPNLIVQEHDKLPYPEGTACAQVLIAGDQGGEFAKNAYWGVAAAFAYALLQKGIRFIAQTPCFITSLKNKFWPSAYVGGEITPEYLGIGYIVGPRLSGVMVAGGVLSWLALIPLLATLLPMEVIAQQLVNLGEMPDLLTAGGPCGWNPLTHTFSDVPGAIYRAYVRQIGAGAVACGGFITLLKTFPTILSSFLSSLKSLKNKEEVSQKRRTDRDLSMAFVLIGCAVLIAVLAFLPILPAHTFLGKIVLAVLIVIFGFFFVTVSSRIVGLIGSSSSPISGMTIATIMGTCLIFISLGWTGHFYEPLALVVGSIVCIAAATSGATSQDLKTGYLIGATPKYQQIALFIGAIVSSFAVGWTIHVLDAPTLEMQAQGITHAIGTAQYPAPQGTLMATLIRGLLSFNLDWQFVLVGAFLALTFELCGVNALSFAVGAYLPISTTLPIFVGGLVRGLADSYNITKNRSANDELSSGSLFATGLVAGGALSGVLIALCSVNYTAANFLASISLEKTLNAILGPTGYNLLGTLCFILLGGSLFSWACFDSKRSEVTGANESYTKEFRADDCEPEGSSLAGTESKGGE